MRTEAKKKKSKEVKTAMDVVAAALCRAIEKTESLRSLIEKAFVAGRSQTSWEQFKSDNRID